MNGRTVAVSAALTLVMLLFCTIPLLSEDTEATDYGDYIITIPQHEGPDKTNHVMMKNGDSKTIVIYILNDCSCILDVGLMTVSERDEIHSEWITNVTLEPKGAKGDLLKFDYVLETDEALGAVLDGCDGCVSIDGKLVPDEEFEKYEDKLIYVKGRYSHRSSYNYELDVKMGYAEGKI